MDIIPVSTAEVRPVRVLIIDDEIEACYNLKHVITSYINRPDLEIVGMAQTTADATAMIQELKPDALFIDIELGKENAFQFLERIAPFSFELIFVTAYDEYAVRAFKLNALDYILKPISIAELSNAIEKLLHKINDKRLIVERSMLIQISENYASKKTADCIRLRTAGKLDIIPFEQLLYIEGKRAYSTFYFKERNRLRTLITSHSITEYEQLVPDHLFFRIHKSYLINCSLIRSIVFEPNPVVFLEDCTALTISRRRLAAFNVFLSLHGYNR